MDAAVGSDPAVLSDFHEWLDRVRATFEAVTYTCTHRLADPALADQVGVQVVAGMVARPAVFRYFGLPFSGRIARLAESLIAQADAGELATVSGWAQLRELLETLPAQHRDALVVMCVRGADIASLATVLACDEATATACHQGMLAHLAELTRPFRAPQPDPDER